MSDEPIDHRKRAAMLRGDLSDTAIGDITWCNQAPSAVTARAALATAHETAAIADLAKEMVRLLEALAGPAAVQAAEQAAIDTPDPAPTACRVCGGISEHQLVEIVNATTHQRDRITCPRATNATGTPVPFIRLPHRPDSKDRIS